MASSTSGIYRWAADIRYRMANDPGRQDLDDHILCNGFLFLDEYLEDILLGARTEPIIELTKTPGRRKDASKKVRAATTATVKVAPIQFHSKDKENFSVTKSPAVVQKAPTSFQKALLKASNDNILNDAEDHQPRFTSPAHADSRSPLGLAVQNRPTGDDNEEEEEEALMTPPLACLASNAQSDNGPELLLPSPTINCPPDATVEPSVRPPYQEINTQTGNGLSLITEGDEGEQSRISLSSSRVNRPVIRDNKILYDVPEHPGEPNGPLTMPAFSYNADDEDDTQGFQTPYEHSFNDSEPTSTASSFPIDPYARDYETHELRHLVAAEDSEQTEQTRPLPSPQPHPLTRKASVPVFPSLPAPSPLHKSMRESSADGPAPARPNAPLGTRSSWLNKGRDLTIKRTSAVGGVKRKSGELVGEPRSSAQADDYNRATKVPKTKAEGGVPAALPDTERPQVKTTIQPFRPVVPTKSRDQLAPVVATPDGNSEGMMNILKRTVEGLGARVGKSMGKSLGGAAATAAAAEAKAAAEARLAQREAKGTDGVRQGRLSVSDLVGVYDTGKGKVEGPQPLEPRAHQSPSVGPESLPQSRGSISTTPPNSPPVPRKQAPSPAPAPTHMIPKFTVQRHAPQEQSFTLPESQPSTQSTYVSSIFDSQSAWPQSSFLTDHTTASQGFSQPQTLAKEIDRTRHDPALDLSKEVGWAESQTDFSVVQQETTGFAKGPIPGSGVSAEDNINRIPGSFDPEDEDMDAGNDGIYAESEEDVRGTMERSTPSPSSESGSSQNKAGSSQPSSQTGIVAQASTLFSKVMGASVGSTLGGSKRGKPEPVKSIQLAAAAAKKQQEEADRKAARLREMDKRRAAIASKKVEQEAVEKAKSQGERRKREREEAPEKKATRATVKKVEEEVVKKRKVVVEIERKPQSKDKKDLGGSRIGKPALNIIQSQPGHNPLSKSFKQPGLPASASQSTVKLVGSSQSELKSTTILQKASTSQTKDKLVTQDMEDIRQPSQTLHAQMQARVQAQLLQARQEEPLIPSESIELPDINSEYSNSDDEDRPRTFDPPDWAQSPDLRNALQSQSRMNPDDIFGPVRALRMEEIFPTRQSRFRARTSSANWTGTDALTPQEQMEYAQRMGYLD